MYEELLDNEDFLRYQDYGLAVLFDRDGYEYFHLPFEITEAEYLTDHFVISPLIVMASADTGFYLLDINFTKPRLFSGSRGSLQQLEVANMPKSFDAEMRRTKFKNHGLGKEDNALADDEKHYLQMIANAVNENMPLHHRALIIAGTTNRIGHIKPLLQNNHIIEPGLIGNFETTNNDDLYNEANYLLRPALQKERQDIVNKINNTEPSLLLVGSAEIEEAAQHGRVDLLAVPSYRLTTDTVQQNEEERAVLELPADIESIESMVRSVVEKGGSVAAVELGSISEPKAICRY